MTCFPVSTHVSISIYTLELEKKSSVAVTFTLFVNAQLTFSPVKYPYCALFRLLLSILYPNIEECVGAFVLKKPPILVILLKVVNIEKFRSISIYTVELEKKSSVAVTFTLLFVNARLTFSPVKHPPAFIHSVSHF